MYACTICMHGPVHNKSWPYPRNGHIFPRLWLSTILSCKLIYPLTGFINIILQLLLRFCFSYFSVLAFIHYLVNQLCCCCSRSGIVFLCRLISSLTQMMPSYRREQVSVECLFLISLQAHLPNVHILSNLGSDPS